MGTRDRILDAAAQIMRDDGIARATTKEIARRAGFSEATLYKHFAGKTEIFVAVLKERAPGLGEMLRSLSERPGQGSVEANLTDAVRAALEFYAHTFTMAVGVFSERRLLEALRADLRQLGAGPELVNRVVSGYLAAEQEHGRVRRDVDPDAIASLLLGACLQRAFFDAFYGREPAAAQPLAIALVRVVVGGIGPSGARP